MAVHSFNHFVEHKLGRFPHFLIYAILEWALMIVLFIDGFLAFFANEFARFFEMPIPCLLCTRIDRIIVQRDPGFYYNDSFCESHMKDASFLAYCHVHRKLSDVRKMCEQCLLSFATEKDSDCDTYKSLLGILHKDFECFVEDDHKVNLKHQMGKKDEAWQAEEDSVHSCSCCKKPLKAKSSYPNTAAIGSSARTAVHLQAPTSTPRAWSMKKYENQSPMLDNDFDVPDDEDGTNAATAGKEYAKSATLPLLAESDYLNEEVLKTPKLLSDESCKTPTFLKGNKFFGIPLTDSTTSTPRCTGSLQRKSPLEKSAAASDLAEGISSNEVDPESILLRLKRQVRLDRKSLINLYMELDEERNASTIAANNAMAMITRLQADKAAVQMDALQYQRMMEEQAEYDQEAVQSLKALLARREEEMKDLDAEVVAYRQKYGFAGRKSIQNGRRKLGSQLYASFDEQSLSVNSSLSFNGECSAVNELNSDEAEPLKEEKDGGIVDGSKPDFCSADALSPGSL